MRKIPEKESMTVEFKSDQKKLPDKTLVEEIVGMANSEGGSLYLGVEDDGTVTGVHKDHQNTIGLNSMIANRTMPSVSVSSLLLIEENVPVIEIRIPTGRIIYATSEGKVLHRRLKQDGSPENIPMYPFEMETRLSDINQLDYSDQILPDAQINDFSALELERLRNLIMANHGDQSLLSLDDTELMLSLHLIRKFRNELFPTVAGMLILGKEERIRQLLPTAQASFQILAGSKVLSNITMKGPLLKTMESFIQIFQNQNLENEIMDGLYRIKVPGFSEQSFREALVNAFVHRDYTVLGQVRVLLDDDGLTITSPGGFIQGLSPDNLLTAEPRGRNPALADVMKRIGLAEKTGRGVDIIYEGSMVFGRPVPDYSESNHTQVRLFIQKAKPDLPFTKMVAQTQRSSRISLSVFSMLILLKLRSSGKMNLSALAREISIGMQRTQANLTRLLDSGMVLEEAGDYFLNPEKLNEVSDQTAGTDELEEQVLVFLSKNAAASRHQIATHLHLGKDKTFRLLKKMMNKGKIEREGSGPATVYRLKADSLQMKSDRKS